MSNSPRATRRAHVQRARKAAHKANLHARTLAAEIERLRAVITEAIDRLTRHQPAERDVSRCGSCGFAYPCSSSWLRDDLSAALKGTTDDD